MTGEPRFFLIVKPAGTKDSSLLVEKSSPSQGGRSLKKTPSASRFSGESAGSQCVVPGLAASA